MFEVVCRDGSTKIPPLEIQQTYLVLQSEAEKIGSQKYTADIKSWKEAGKPLKRFRFSPSLEHRTLVKAMADVLNGQLTPERAMLLLNPATRSPDISENNQLRLFS